MVSGRIGFEPHRPGVDFEFGNLVWIGGVVTPRSRGAVYPDAGRHAIVKPPHSAGLPTAQEAVEDGVDTAAKVLASAEGDLPDIADLEHLRDVPFRERALELAVVGVAHLAESTDPSRTGGHGGIVDGLGVGVRHHERQPVPHALLHLDLQGVIDGVGPRRVDRVETVDLRIRAYEVAGGNRRSANPAADGVDDAGIGIRYLRAQRVQGPGLGVAFLFHPGPEVLLAARTVEVQVRAFGADVVGFHQHVAGKFVLHPAAPSLRIRWDVLIALRFGNAKALVG